MPELDTKMTLSIILLAIGLLALLASKASYHRYKSQSSRVATLFSILIIVVSLYLAKNVINAFLGIANDPVAQYAIDVIAWTAFAWIAMRSLSVVLWRGILSENGELLIPSFIVYLTNFFIILVTLTLFQFIVLNQNVTILATSAGGLLLGIGYLAKHPLESIFAGLSFTLSPMFKKGDRVAIYVDFLGEHVGTIKKMGWLHISMQSKEGHIIHLHNTIVERSIVTNFSQPMHKPCYTTNITLEYEVPMAQGYKLINEALQDLNDWVDKFSIRSEKFSRFGITYLIRFWTNDKQNYDEVVHAINSAVYYKIQKHKELDFGYDKFGSLNASKIADKVDATHRFAQSALNLSKEEQISILRRVNIFESLNDADIEGLAGSVTPRVFGPPERVVRQDESGDSMFVIARGHALVYLKTPNQPPIELVRHGPGKFFGEMALLTGEPRGASVRAIDDLLVLEIPKTALAKIFEKQPHLAGKIADSVAKMQEENRKLSEMNPQQSDSASSIADAIRIKVQQFFGLQEH